MKKHFAWMMAAILSVSLCSVFTSCSKDSEENNSNTQPTTETENTSYSDVDVENLEVLESGEIPLYDMLQENLKAYSGGNGPEDEMMRAHFQKAIDELEEYAKKESEAQGSNDWLSTAKGCLLDYSYVNIITTSADGSKIPMSTLIAWPKLIAEHKADHAILGCHCTFTDDVKRPSNFKNVSMSSDVGIIVGQWASVSGICGYECLVIMPDYEGYGSTKDRSHPYLNREVQARQCIDAVGQGIDWYNKKHKGMAKNFKIVSVGYSQGGAVAAATYRYCLEHEDVRKILPMWEGAVCGDGPYDPFATIVEYCSTNRLYMPVAPILMLKGLCDSDAEMKKIGAKPEDFMSAAASDCGIISSIASKEKDTYLCDMCIAGYNDKHPGSFRTGKDDDGSNYFYTCDVLNQATFDYFRSKGATLPTDQVMAEKLKTLAHCLKKNALFYKDDKSVWMPPTGAKFTFFHSAKDEVVGYCNLQSVIDAWGVTNNSCLYMKYDKKTYKHEATGKAFFAERNYSDTFIDLMLRNKWESGFRTLEGIVGWW